MLCEIYLITAVQKHKLYLIEVGQLNTEQISQDQFLNQVQKVSTMKHTLQEWL